MNTVGFLKLDNGIYYYYFFLDGKCHANTHRGSGVLLRRKLLKLRVESVLGLFCQFRNMEESIIDHLKDVEIFRENKKRIQDYIDWGYANYESQPEKVLLNALQAIKFCDVVLRHINDEQELKKELIFLYEAIVVTSSSKDEIPIE